ncbi:hypothetical protein [Enterococcus lactis]|uniref:hypothetical protein n=1 Tax=Enterococcus lactis TaxID=357441 RepID=UPI0024122E73|nr:hypothetical protein [Enterococcus lactis]
MKKGIINAAEGIMKRSIEIKGDSQEIESEDLVIISLQNSLVEKAKDINYLLDKKKNTINQHYPQIYVRAICFINLYFERSN